MIQYTLTQIKSTRPEALFCGRWDKQLLRFRDKMIFLNTNTDLFQVIVDYLNNKKYHVSRQYPGKAICRK